MQNCLLAFHTGSVYQLAHVQLSVSPHALELFFYLIKTMCQRQDLFSSKITVAQTFFNQILLQGSPKQMRKTAWYMYEDANIPLQLT